MSKKDGRQGGFASFELAALPCLPRGSSSQQPLSPNPNPNPNPWPSLRAMATMLQATKRNLKTQINCTVACRGRLFVDISENSNHQKLFWQVFSLRLAVLCHATAHTHSHNWKILCNWYCSDNHWVWCYYCATINCTTCTETSLFRCLNDDNVWWGGAFIDHLIRLMYFVCRKNRLCICFARDANGF